MELSQIFNNVFKIFKVEDEKGETFIPPSAEDDSHELIVDNGGNNSFYNDYSIDLDELPKDESGLINTYRNMMLNHDIDIAVKEITNEAIIMDSSDNNLVELNLDKIETLSDNIKDKIIVEFDTILKLLNFNQNGNEIFKRWYVDGKLVYHSVIDSKNIKNGIIKLVKVNPLNILSVREIKSNKSNKNIELDLYNVKDVKEYYIYSSKGITNSNYRQGNSHTLKIPKSLITYVTSGLLSPDGNMNLSELYKVIKPYNNLKMMEDSIIIYRVSRAPERRIFYVDVGSMQSGKADQYIKSVMDKFKSNISYDVNTGAIKNRSKFQSLLEDYWLPRREGGRGTEVSTLPSGDALGELTDVEYFKNKLYRALNIPLSRFETGTGFNIGRSSEISRDEIRFNKFIIHKRIKFNSLFTQLLKTQLILRNVITLSEWNSIENLINYKYLKDNYFSELKELEIAQDRIELYGMYVQSGVIGTLYSYDTIRRNIFKQSDIEIEHEDKLIKAEKSNPQFKIEEPNNDF